MKQLGFLLVLCSMTLTMWAMPARRGGVVKAQPDGTNVIVFQQGDEYFHWMVNEKGEWIERGDDGYYRVTEALTTEVIAARRMARVAPREDAASTLNIAPRGLVILVNFQDCAFRTPKAEMDSMLMAENYTRDYTYIKRNDEGETEVHVQAVGSARKYFLESSVGQYNPQFDVVGPVTVSRDMEYYGKNVNNFDKAPWTMVKEACELVNDSVDFSLYDNDNDGKVDFVYIIYAGYGEADGADANTIWPHSYTLSSIGTYCKVDDKRVDLYACGNELDLFTEHHTGIGPFCHEFSHVLGLPDFYITVTGLSHRTLDMWSIMDYGSYTNECNTPPTYSAYERFFMGWLTPKLITEPENIQLEELQSTNTALLISSSDEHNLIGNDPNPTTFYMLENRQQVGWDTHLPGHGLMLTKIQYDSRSWSGNKVNNDPSKMGVDLIEADGNKKNHKESRPTDLFPAGATEYKKIEGHWISDIVETDDIIYFAYKSDNTSVGGELQMSEEILAIYNILGQKLATTELQSLPSGTYVLVNSSGKNKIVRK